MYLSKVTDHNLRLIFPTSQQKQIKSTFHKCIVNVTPATNPTPMSESAKYEIKSIKNKIQLQICFLAFSIGRVCQGPEGHWRLQQGDRGGHRPGRHNGQGRQNWGGDRGPKRQGNSKGPRRAPERNRQGNIKLYIGLIWYQQDSLINNDTYNWYI